MKQPCPNCGERFYHRRTCITYLAARAASLNVEAGPLSVPELRNENGGKFVAVRRAIMRGSECVATAISHTMARRISNALNNHTPNSKGY